MFITTIYIYINHIETAMCFVWTMELPELSITILKNVLLEHLLLLISHLSTPNLWGVGG